LGVRLKNIISVSLLLIFLFHFAGFYVYFIFSLNGIHKQMRNELKATPFEKLQVFSFSKTDFEKKKIGEDEMKVNGKMYDIARVEENSESITVYCVQDGAEDNLLSFLDQILKNASRDKKPLPSVAFTFLSQADLSHCLILPCNSSVELPTAFTAYLNSLSNYSPRLLVPPPRS
jgi:hypothetical protein